MDCAVAVRDENSEPFRTCCTRPLDSACSSTLALSAGLALADALPLAWTSAPLAADMTADTRAWHSPVAVCANGPAALGSAGTVALTDAPPWTDPEPEKVPVVAASATPPVAKTASDA